MQLIFGIKYKKALFGKYPTEPSVKNDLMSNKLQKKKLLV